MNSFMETYQRIQLATNTRTQGELANILEIRQSSISDAKRRNTIPSRWYMQLFEKFGLSQDWLRYGVGPMYLRTEQGYMPQGEPAAQQDPAHLGDPAAKCAFVAVYSMHYLPNETSGILELELVGKLAIPSSFAGPDMLVLLSQANDMAPTVRQGAYLGVNTADTRPLSGGVFALKHNHAGLLVRRIFLDCGNNLYILRSDAGNYPESIVPADECVERIVGRVSWVMQDVV